ncbi:hypothetical protein CBM2587_B70033 [Cupriavidus taiwanensis]|uniref:Uncharacterized protein n=1 Tax=Cupriavidus taiwanensis TaxID=164546 RepID=A0A375CAX9_9BURK|nr:hypothetical protein CBM2587_B70033 [Cupriavidus taiwanensis]
MEYMPFINTSIAWRAPALKT